MAEPREPESKEWHLKSPWPGLEADRDGVTYDADKIKTCANELREALKGFTGESGVDRGRGSIEDLTQYGGLTELRMQLESIQRWEGGRMFAGALETSYNEFLAIYREVQAACQTAISLVDAGAGNYQAASTANEGGR